MSEAQATVVQPAAKRRVISRGTVSTVVALFGLLAVFGVLNALSYAGSLSGAGDDAVYVFGTALAVLPAAVMLWAARAIGPASSVGKQWLLLALGACAFAAGDVVWTVIELVLEQDPYPSVADLLYPLMYACFLAALVIAIKSYSSLMDIKRPLVLGTVVALLSAVLVYLTVLQPYVFKAGPAELGIAGLVVSTFYPLGDVMVLLGPAVALALVMGPLGSGRFAWPWWLVIAGALVFTVTDSYFSYADWAGIGTTAVLDLGWLAALALFAGASLVARDVYRS